MRIATTAVLMALACVMQVEAQQKSISLSVTDVDSGTPLPARVYLEDDQGRHFFFSSGVGDSGAVRYNKQNWNNSSAIERHTTVSAHPCTAVVPPGHYTLTVHHGKTYFPWVKDLDVTDRDVAVVAKLRRWINTSALGWYSGDAHIHRTIDELRNIVLAEDLNVVFPLTNWVTLADTPPAAGDKNIDVDLTDKLIHVDEHHVIWPRNTEYEIFSVAGQRHTLGALFVLGHEGPLTQTVPPWQPVIAAAIAADSQVVFDMDKLSWPFAMVLPTVAPTATYEIVNNHLWRTEFGFRDWYTRAPPYMQPPFGGTRGGERDWIDFTLGMYYTLLDCGFRMPPSAGTANGVHPVPAGFGRVYVHLPDGFDYQAWRDGLQQGRSFVTTGPMLFATAEGKDPGHVFQSSTPQKSPLEIPLHIEVVSEQPLAFGELLINGVPEHLLRVQNQRTELGAYRSVIDMSVTPQRSGWFALRFWEDREQGRRVRFVHSAPWYVELDGEPIKPRHEEKAYLIRRIEDEMQRSRGVVSEQAMNEYQRALERYKALPAVDDTDLVRRNARPLASEADREHWLENMILHHRLTPQEVRLATGMSIDAAGEAINRVLAVDPQASSEPPELRILPYPGGRHPRRGFLDGAIDPQRDTKVSIFPPWADGGYAVVDVPEAIFSNLGLTYLAHQHIPTIWSEQSIELERLEWKEEGGALVVARQLPNGIAFGSRVAKRGDMVAMEMWLTNGTDQPLTGLRSQVCVMLKGLVGFTSQRHRDQLVREPFVAVKADETDRWLITAWTPNNRAWTNPPVPCVHSDPVFPDCPPGETVKVRGGLWFYEGDDIEAEIARLKIP